MSDVVPDPTQPERLGIDNQGRLVGGVHVRRLDAHGTPVDGWQWVGWCSGFSIAPLDHTKQEKP